MRTFVRVPAAKRSELMASAMSADDVQAAYDEAMRYLMIPPDSCILTFLPRAGQAGCVFRLDFTSLSVPVFQYLDYHCRDWQTG